MRQKPGALRPVLLSTLLTLSVTRALTLAPYSLVPMLLTYSAITAGVYALACIFSDPDSVLVDMWVTRSLLPALAGSISASLIAASLWQSNASIGLLVCGGTAYLGLVVLWVSVIRRIVKRAF